MNDPDILCERLPGRSDWWKCIEQMLQKHVSSKINLKIDSDKSEYETLNVMSKKSTTPSKTFKVPTQFVYETVNAIGLTIKRVDGGLISRPVYFPKSQCTIIKESDGSYVITIPTWLLKNKLPANEQIIVG